MPSPHKRNGSIHFAADIVCLSARTDDSFVMDGDGSVLFDIVIAVVLAFETSGLVTERPHTDTGVVTIAEVHSLHAIPIQIFIKEIVTDAVDAPGVVIHTVRFDIRFVDDVQTVAVAKP